MSQFNSISLNGNPLRPAPFISTSYEYNKSGDYIIGGFLILTLSGTLVGEKIEEEIEKINDLQTQFGCFSVVIGCSGQKDFLDGSGRIRTVTFSPSDQPFVQNYTMIIAIETVDSKPAVEVDQDFIEHYCFDEEDKLDFLQNYTEKLTFQGEGNTIASVDTNTSFNVSKSFVKISGEINISFYGRTVCGLPEYNGINNAKKVLKKRAERLLSLKSCNNTLLDKYKNWNKWLDTKKISINIDGSLTWSFDMYLSEGNAKPYAWIDIDTEDKKDHTKNKKNNSISGRIKGLSLAAIDDYLENKIKTNERIDNAQKAYTALENIIKNGSWPSTNIVLYDIDDKETDTKKYNFCRQRLSSNLVKSVVAGEINFSAEFGDISNCQSSQEATIDVTIDESFSVNRYVEFIIPNSSVIVQKIAPSTPAKVVITARGTVNGCNTDNTIKLSSCVDTELTNAYNKLSYSRKLILMSEKKNIGKFSYTTTKEYIACDSGSLGSKNCTTNTKPINLYKKEDEDEE